MLEKWSIQFFKKREVFIYTSVNEHENKYHDVQDCNWFHWCEESVHMEHSKSIEDMEQHLSDSGPEQHCKFQKHHKTFKSINEYREMCREAKRPPLIRDALDVMLNYFENLEEFDW